MARSTELAIAAVQAILAVRGRGVTRADDPSLDDAILLIQEGLRCGPKFVEDLVRQAMASGMVLDAPTLIEMLITAAKLAGTIDYKTSKN